MAKAESIELLGQTIEPGTRRHLSIPVVRLYTDTPIDLRMEVIHGKQQGPCLLVTAAIHGDELNGVEICRQLLGHRHLAKIQGTLIVIPVVNQLGFIHQIRYLPDRRDLNRCFPGSSKGSLGGRLAEMMTSQLLPKVDFAIDLHTGAIHRTNLPQLRTDLSNGYCLAMARAFAAPVILNSALRDGSFRHAAHEQGIPTLVYEAGEALRLDPASIRLGLKGIFRVMRHLKMLPGRSKKPPLISPWECNQSLWLRSSSNGVVLLHTQPGQRVVKGTLLISIVNPFDASDTIRIDAPFDGVIIGLNQLPLANEGDALVHLARTDSRRSSNEYDQEAVQENLEMGNTLQPMPNESI